MRFFADMIKQKPKSTSLAETQALAKETGAAWQALSEADKKVCVHKNCWKWTNIHMCRHISHMWRHTRRDIRTTWWNIPSTSKMSALLRSQKSINNAGRLENRACDSMRSGDARALHTSGSCLPSEQLLFLRPYVSKQILCGTNVNVHGGR